MKFIHVCLVGYFVLIVGVALAVWQTAVMNRVAPIWIVRKRLVGASARLLRTENQLRIVAPLMCAALRLR
jgi:hypothetical protein